MTDPAGNAWTWGFNLLGQRTTQTDPNSGTSNATYDLLGNMLTTTDARGKKIATTYDALNRKTAQYVTSSSGAKLAAWTYDTLKKGKLTSSTSYDGSTSTTLGKAYASTILGYDVAGNVTQSKVSIPSGAPGFGGTSYTTSYTYNSDSSLATKTTPLMGGLAASTIRYGYDAWGGLTSVAENNGKASYTLILGSVTRNAIGQTKILNRQTGVAALGYSQYTYDPATNALVGINDWANWNGGGAVISDRTYTRDKAGSITAQTVTASAPTSGTQKTCYKYDGLSQLTRAWTPNTASSCSTTPSTTTMGGIAPFWQEFTYNTLNGNRTGATARTTAGVVSSAIYAYPASGSGVVRPHAVTTVTGSAALGVGTYSYDASGNMTGKPGQTLTYNDVGKLTKVVAGTETQTSIYDVNGQLILTNSTANGASLYLGDTTLTKPAGSSTVYGYRTYSGPGAVPVAQRLANTGTTVASYNWLYSGLDGTVDAQSVALTGVVTRQWRDPFGAPLAGMAAAWADNTGFLGKAVNKTTKLTTVGARVYDGVIGKFTSVDPIIQPGLPQQNTGYSYAHNNPINLADPDGLSPQGPALDDGGSWVGISRVARRPISLVPGTKASYDFGDELQRRGQEISDSAKFLDTGAYVNAYGHKNAASFFKSQQGALIHAWTQGSLPDNVQFGAGSPITQGLREHFFVKEYRREVQKALANDADWETRRWDASTTGGQMEADLVTVLAWGIASQEDRSLAVNGSYQIDATTVEEISDNQVRVQFTISNNITLGSGISFTQGLRDFGYSMAPSSGGFSDRTVHYVWTETLSK